VGKLVIEAKVSGNERNESTGVFARGVAEEER